MTEKEAQSDFLLAKDIKRIRKMIPNNIPIDKHRIRNLSDYISLIAGLLNGASDFWFRGQADIQWKLTPSGLRFQKKEHLEGAVAIVRDFQRIAESKLSRAPREDETLRWLQLAQHYGVPTRLLDWTESATAALYFAVETSSDKNDTDGVVYLFKSSHLRIISGSEADDDVRKYQQDRRLKPIGVKPIWNSERIVAQRGAFTLHSRYSQAFDEKVVPSLWAIPIMKGHKKAIRNDLESIGTDELSLFPELEHAARYLKKMKGLISYE